MNVGEPIAQKHRRRYKISEKQKIRGGSSLESNIYIFSVMEKFVASVDKMDKIVMIPSKLMDMAIDDKDPKIPNSIKKESDLHGVYLMLNSLKRELNDSRLSENSEDIMTVNNRMTGHRNNSAASKRANGFASTTSLSSLESDTNSEYETDSDSGKQSDSDTCNDKGKSPSSNKVTTVGQRFRMHLHGLHDALVELAVCADYLSDRYQNEVGF